MWQRGWGRCLGSLESFEQGGHQYGRIFVYFLLQLLDTRIGGLYSKRQTRVYLRFEGKGEFFFYDGEKVIRFRIDGVVF